MDHFRQLRDHRVLNNKSDIKKIFGLENPPYKARVPTKIAFLPYTFVADLSSIDNGMSFTEQTHIGPIST